MVRGGCSTVMYISQSASCTFWLAWKGYCAALQVSSISSARLRLRLLACTSIAVLFSSSTQQQQLQAVTGWVLYMGGMAAAAAAQAWLD